MGIDKSDESILGILMNDADATMDDIAKKLKLHKNTIALRIKKMEKEGIIQGHFWCVDYMKFGIGTGIVFSLIVRNRPDIQKALVQSVALIPQIESLVVKTGRYNVGGTMWTKNIDEAYSILDKIRKDPIVLEVTFDMVTKIHKQRCNFNPFSSEVWQKENHSGEIKQITDIDFGILEVLSQDAIPFTELAKNLGVSASKIKSRVRRMEQTGIILGKKVRVDPIKLGYNDFTMLRLKLCEKTDVGKVLSNLLRIPEIYDVRSVSGDYDLELIFLSRGTMDTLRLLSRFTETEGILRGELEVAFIMLKGSDDYKPLQHYQDLR